MLKINGKNHTTLVGRALLTDHPVRYHLDATIQVNLPAQAASDTHLSLSTQSQYFAIIRNYIVISLAVVSVYTTQQLTIVHQTTKKVYSG